jgi:hypothetical protein
METLNNTTHVDYEILLNDIINKEEPSVTIIKGEWGIGKTFFIRELLNQFKEQRTAYVSLFNHESVNDLKSKIIFDLVSPTGIAQKGSAISTILSKIPLLEQLNSISNLSDCIVQLAGEKYLNGTVICFDDIERKPEHFSFDVFLGFLSILKEVHQCKILLIMNDKELDTAELDELGIYKEKIIDYEINYQPTNTEIIKSLIHKSGISDKYCAIVVEEILNSNESNLRSIKKAISVCTDIINHRDLTISQTTIEYIIKRIILTTIFHHKYPDSGDVHISSLSKEDKREYTLAEKYYVEHQFEMIHDDFNQCIKSYLTTHFLDIHIINKHIDHLTDNMRASTIKNEIYDLLSKLRYAVKDSEEDVIRNISSTIQNHIFWVIDALGFDNYLYIINMIEDISGNFYQDLLYGAIENYTDRIIFQIKTHSDLRKFLSSDNYTEIMKIDNEKIKNDIMMTVLQDGSWNQDIEKRLNTLTESELRDIIYNSQDSYKTLIDFIRYFERNTDKPFFKLRESVIQVLEKLEQLESKRYEYVINLIK